MTSCTLISLGKGSAASQRQESPPAQSEPRMQLREVSVVLCLGRELLLPEQGFAVGAAALHGGAGGGIIMVVVVKAACCIVEGK